MQERQELTEDEKKFLQMEHTHGVQIEGCTVCKHKASHGAECFYGAEELEFNFCRFERDERFNFENQDKKE